MLSQWQNFILLWLSNIPLYTYATSSLFIHLLVDAWVASINNGAMNIGCICPFELVFFKEFF